MNDANYSEDVSFLKVEQDSNTSFMAITQEYASSKNLSLDNKLDKDKLSEFLEGKDFSDEKYLVLCTGDVGREKRAKMLGELQKSSD